MCEFFNFAHVFWDYFFGINDLKTKYWVQEYKHLMKLIGKPPLNEIVSVYTFTSMYNLSNSGCHYFFCNACVRECGGDDHVVLISIAVISREAERLPTSFVG